MSEYASALADQIDAALGPWVVRCVTTRAEAWRGSVDPVIAAAATAAGRQAQAETGSAVRALLAADIDDQRTTPLALVRAAVRYPTEVLRHAGVPPVVRDPFDERAFPDDIYGLSPASFADIDPSLADPGLAWGAAKAFEHKRRHRS
jgi:hypothetical protein